MLLAIIGGYTYNEISGICSEDFLDAVMNDVDEKENAVKFIEISEQEWEDYETWSKDRNHPTQKEILGRHRLVARRVTGWRLE